MADPASPPPTGVGRILQSGKALLALFVAAMAFVVMLAVAIPVAILMANGRIDPVAGAILLSVTVLGGILGAVTPVIMKVIGGWTAEDVALKTSLPPPPMRVEPAKEAKNDAPGRSTPPAA